MSGLWALVPLKYLAEAKQRLAPVLESAPRMELVLSMASDVLAALVSVKTLERVLLVSEDPGVAQFALDAGVELFQVPAGGGLNSDLERAAAYAWEQGAGRVLIVHADLPFLTGEKLQHFIANRPDTATCLAACKTCTGTNLLLTSLPLTFPLVFGLHSLAGFNGLLGGMSEVVRDSVLSWDIDEPKDLDRLLMHGAGDAPPGSATRAWLAAYGHLLGQTAGCAPV